MGAAPGTLPQAQPLCLPRVPQAAGWALAVAAQGGRACWAPTQAASGQAAVPPTGRLLVLLREPGCCCSLAQQAGLAPAPAALSALPHHYRAEQAQQRQWLMVGSLPWLLLVLRALREVQLASGLLRWSPTAVVAGHWAAAAGRAAAAAAAYLRARCPAEEQLLRHAIPPQQLLLLLLLLLPPPLPHCLR